jgi:hypothetical protein
VRESPRPWKGDCRGVHWNARSLEMGRVDGVHGALEFGDIGDGGSYAIPRAGPGADRGGAGLGQYQSVKELRKDAYVVQSAPKGLASAPPRRAGRRTTVIQELENILRLIGHELDLGEIPTGARARTSYICTAGQATAVSTPELSPDKDDGQGSINPGAFGCSYPTRPRS